MPEQRITTSFGDYIESELQGGHQEFRLFARRDDKGRLLFTVHPYHREASSLDFHVEGDATACATLANAPDADAGPTPESAGTDPAA